MKTEMNLGIRRMLTALTLVVGLFSATASLADSNGLNGKGGQETGGIVRSGAANPVDFNGKGGQETGG